MIEFMNEFVFLDTDITGTEDYDIKGRDYSNLINICCKYCTVLSFRIVNSEISFQKELEKFQIPRPENIKYVYRHYYKNLENQSDIKYFRVCQELKDLLLEIADSIFELICGWDFKNPEDPVFYRDDGSVFFSSIIHDGKCFLFPTDSENISDIVSSGHWIHKNEIL